MNNAAAFGLIAAVTIIGGATVGILTGHAQWYASLAKPVYAPPFWLFPPLWVIAYLAVAFVGWAVWRRRARARGLAWGFWCCELLFVWQWQPVLMGLHLPEMAFVGLAVAILIGVGLGLFLIRRAPHASAVQAGFALWLVYVGAVTLAIANLNPRL